MCGKKSKQLHKKRKSLSAPLSADLREDYGFRSISIREGDDVELMRGDYKGAEGEVTEVQTDSEKIIVDGVETSKVDESEVTVPVRPSNVKITNLEKDEMRDKIIERRSEGVKERKEEASEETERSEDVEDAEEE